MHTISAVRGGKAGVFLLPLRNPLPEHELKTHAALGERIAALIESRFKGSYDAEFPPLGSLYFIPSDTLIGQQQRQALDIKTGADFFGGWVQEPFMATKAITHPLFDAESKAPTEWSPKFGMSTGNAVLRGFTAFSIKDAHHAAHHLLQYGPVRIKAVRACAGRGQTRVEDKDQLAQVLARIDENEIAIWGLTLEEDLQQVMTYSVGQAEVGGTLISYIGTQNMTRNNSGDHVYGGSRLAVVRGGYAELLELKLSERTRLAIAQARIYETAAFASFPGLLASRRNYDVAQGFDARGEFRSGVLEQSWRIGGASGAEILALEAFAQDDQLWAINASTREVYGACEPPVNACVLYRGDDTDVGPITKYAELSNHDDAYKTHSH